MSRRDRLVELGKKPPPGAVWVPTARDDVTGDPCEWRWVPQENVDQWDVRNWG